MQISNKMKGLLFVLASAASFGTGAIFIKLAYKIQLPWWEFTSLQLMLTCCMLLIPYTIKRWKKQEKPIPPSTILRLAIMGICGSLPACVFYNVGLVYLDASIGIVLFYTYPIFTAMGAGIFFREKIRPKHYLCLLLTVTGTVCTIQLWKANLHAVSLTGVLLVILSALGYTFFTLYGQKNLVACSSMAITTFTQVFAFLAFSIIKPPLYLLHGVSLQALTLTFIMAFFNSALAYWLMLKGIDLIGASKSAIVSTSEIPVTIILAMLILAERPNIFQAVGAAFIICSIIFLDLEDKKAPIPEA